MTLSKRRTGGGYDAFRTIGVRDLRGPGPQLAAKAAHLPVGNPATEQVALGPVIDQGARLAAGGEYDEPFYKRP